MGKIDHTFLLFCREILFQLIGYVNAQNDNYYSAENPMLSHKVLLHDVPECLCVCARAHMCLRAPPRTCVWGGPLR
jgi:hypothetical protein